MSSVVALSSCNAMGSTDRSSLERGLAGAIKGCSEWILEPDSWINGPAPFLAAVDLGDRMGRVAEVDEAALPPRPMRLGNRYWRINSTERAGFVLVVSDQIPMCHITGGGDFDFQPMVESVIASGAFLSRWQQRDAFGRGDMMTTVFQNQSDPALSIVVSRATRAGARRDRVQVLVTAIYAPES